MSAIGEYIHLMEENYLKYGTTRYTRVYSNQPPWVESLQQQRELNRQRLDPLKANNENIKNLLPGLRQTISKNFKESEDAKNIAKNYGNFYESVSDFQERFKAKLSAEIPNGVEGVLSGNIKSMRMDNQIDEKALEEAKEIRKKIINAINIINNSMLKEEPVDPKYMNIILENTKLFFDKIGVIESENYLALNMDLQNQTVLSALKGALLLVPLNKMTKSALNGTLGEVIVSMSVTTAEGKAKEEITKTILEAIKGDEKTSFSFDRDMLSPEVAKTFESKDKPNLYKVYSTQNKVDVSITIGEEPLDISVKMYKAREGIIKTHLQDVTLLYTLAATAGDFANHWISLHAYQIGNAEMDEALKDQIAYEALIHGNMLKQGVLAANVFIAIDTSSGKVYANTTFDMLQRDAENNLKNFSFSPSISGIEINNNGAGITSVQRIAGIISFLHQTKIKVKYRAALGEGIT